MRASPQMKTAVVTLKYPFHCRPAALFTLEARRWVSDVAVVRNGVTANGKNIVFLMALAVPRGESITLHVSGPDEDAAIAALSRFFLREE